MEDWTGPAPYPRDGTIGWPRRPGPRTARATGLHHGRPARSHPEACRNVPLRRPAARATANSKPQRRRGRREQHSWCFPLRPLRLCGLLFAVVAVRSPRLQLPRYPRCRPVSMTTVEAVTARPAVPQPAAVETTAALTWPLYAVVLSSARHRGRAPVGHLVAQHHRPRQLLERASPARAAGRDRGRYQLRLAGPPHHLRRNLRPARRVGAILGIPGTARRLGDDLGHLRHDRVGPVRQLVAQRLRPRRQDREPAPHGARPRHDLGRAGRHAHGPGSAEPRHGPGPNPEARLGLRDRRRHPRHHGRHADLRVCQPAEPHAQSPLLPGRRRGVPYLPRGLRTRRAAPLARNHHRRPCTPRSCWR
jgi:hypothetical protein